MPTGFTHLESWARSFPSPGWGRWREAPDGVWPAAATLVRIARPSPQSLIELSPAFRTPSGPPGHLPRFAEKEGRDEIDLCESRSPHAEERRKPSRLEACSSGRRRPSLRKRPSAGSERGREERLWTPDDFRVRIQSFQDLAAGFPGDRQPLGAGERIASHAEGRRKASRLEARSGGRRRPRSRERPSTGSGRGREEGRREAAAIPGANSTDRLRRRARRASGKSGIRRVLVLTAREQM